MPWMRYIGLESHVSFSPDGSSAQGIPPFVEKGQPVHVKQEILEKYCFRERRLSAEIHKDAVRAEAKLALREKRSPRPIERVQIIPSTEWEPCEAPEGQE